MTEMVVDYATLALTEQVLARQDRHAHAIADHLADHADIGDATGLLLGMFDPLSRAAVDAGRRGAQALGELDAATAQSVSAVAAGFVEADGLVRDTMLRLLAEVGRGPAPPIAPSPAGPVLPAAGESAPDDYGQVDSYLWQKVGGAGETLGDAARDARALLEEVGRWGPPGQVSELVDASSFLVAPQAPDNFVQDLRWSAGLLLGSIDWVAEQFLGFSILDRCVYHPLAGDWQGLYRAGEAWGHGGDAAQAIARNHAGLVSGTTATWEGHAGNAFRAAQATVAGGALGLSYAYDYAGGLVQTVSTVCKLACAGIGAALNTIANILLKMAAEAATPVIGWVVGAVTAYDDLNKVVRNVRLVYTILETVASAIQDFVGAKTAVLDAVTVLEDLLEGAVESAGAVA